MTTTSGSGLRRLPDLIHGWITLGAGVLVFGLMPGASLETLAVDTFVLPPSHATMDGRNGSSVLRSVIRLQDAYGASLFPGHPILIRGLRFRPSTVAMGALTSSIPDIQFNLSTTTRSPEGLSSTLAQNVGDDDTVVFHGPLELASAYSGPEQGPKAFDLVVPLMVPFQYDPTAGNLLVDIRNFSGSAITWVDVAGGGGDQAGRAFALDANATVAGTVDVGADVLEVLYEVVPTEPSISVQPQSRTALVGATVTFTVTAGGSPPLAYQWFFNEDPVPGETNSKLVLINIEELHTGNYAVVVSNSLGSVASSNALLTVKPAVAGSTLVVPQAFAEVDAGNGSSLLRSVIRLQDVYGASLFPGHPIMIRGLRFRPSAAYGHAFNTTIGDIQINMSTTTARPENLRTVFAENVGPDDTLVFRGALSLSSSFNGPAEGPKDFDIVIPLATPFAYDPAAGNLLIDYRNFCGSTVTYVDAGGSVNDLASRAFALDPNASAASTVDCGAELLQVVFSEEPSPPRIIAHPRSLTVLVNSPAAFAVTASGAPPLTYQWEHDGAPLEGATNATLTLDSVQAEHGGDYSVVVANALGSTVSSNAVLTVRSNGASGSVVVPQAYELVDGRNGSGLLNNMIRLQEVYGASLFTQGPIAIREIRFRPSARFGSTFVATIADIQINLSTTTAPAEQLNRVFANNVGADDTVVFRGAVTVSSSFSGPPEGPKAFDIVIPLTTPFVYDPAAGNLLIDYRNFSGSAATFVDAGGSASDQGSRAFALGATSTTATTVDHGAEVLQLVYYSGPTQPSILAQPQNLAVAAASTATLSIVAVGTPPLAYQWQFNSEPLSGATNPSLILNNVRVEQAGAYSVVVSNTVGSVTSVWVTLTVLTNGFDNAVVVPAVFERRDANNGSGVLNTVIRLQEVYGSALFPPKPVTIREIRFRPSAAYGQAFNATIADFQVNMSTTHARPENLSAKFADNVGPDDVVVFRGSLALSSSFNGPAQGPKFFDMIVPLATPFVYDPAAGNLLIEFRNYSGSTVTFVDAGATIGDQASRAFALGADAATATTLDGGADVLEILWSDEPMPPSILVQPRDVRVAAGSAAQFSVVAGGSRPLSYQWLFNEQELEGETNATLVISGVGPAQAGDYSVRVANEVGFVVSIVAVLTVESGDIPASITLITPSQTVNPGATVTLAVVANGAEPLNYQWSFNGALLFGATTSELVLSEVGLSQAGTYSVTVSNAFGPPAVASTVLNVNPEGGATVSFQSVVNTNWSFVFDEDGVTKLEGPAYLAQLYGGPDSDSLAPVGAAVAFMTGPGAGLFFGGIRYIPTVPASEVASVQARAWESAAGTTFEAAKEAGGKVGWSAILRIMTGGGGIPPVPPARLTGLESFSIQRNLPGTAPVVMAESLVTPPSLTAGSWTGGSEGQGLLRGDSMSSGAANLVRQFQFRFKGVPGADYAVEVSTNLVDWTPLINLLNTTGSAVVVDADASHFAHRFYRARLLR